MQQRKGIYKDTLLDLLLMTQEYELVESRQDLDKLVATFVRSQLDIKPQTEESSFINECRVHAGIWFSSEGIDETQRLVDAVHTSATTENSSKPIIMVSGDKVVVRCPAYDKTNHGQTDNLGKYLKWACTILGVQNPKISLVFETELGNSIILPARIARMMDNTIASLTLPPGEAGDKAEFKSGLKANLVELLAAIRLMRRFGPALQRGKGPKDAKHPITTLQDLKESLNGRAGLKETGKGIPCDFLQGSLQ
jgi:hypothetical protein